MAVPRVFSPGLVVAATLMCESTPRAAAPRSRRKSLAAGGEPSLEGRPRLRTL